MCQSVFCVEPCAGRCKKTKVAFAWKEMCSRDVGVCFVEMLEETRSHALSSQGLCHGPACRAGCRNSKKERPSRCAEGGEVEQVLEGAVTPRGLEGSKRVRGRTNRPASE